MNNNLAELVFILDMTGSMQPLRAEAVQGFNNFLEEQKKVPGDALITLITFNSGETKRVYDRVPLPNAASMAPTSYNPDNMTPLLDTIGNTIEEVGHALKVIPEEERPGKVIFVIMTDGEENFSLKYDRKAVFDAITHQRDVYKWEFIFLGANQDSYLEAGLVGVKVADTQNYRHDADGMQAAYSFASARATAYRIESQTSPGGD